MLTLSVIQLTGTRTCTSSWFERYWTVYWDADSGTNVVVTGSGCSKWRAVLCFTFLISMLWLLSGFLVSCINPSRYQHA